MIRNPGARPSLGEALREARRRAGVRQTDLGLSAATVRQLERGSGSLGSLELALAVLRLEAAARSLPGSGPLGPRMRELRESRRVSRRSLADAAAVHASALAALERGDDVHLSVVERAARALGIVLHLVPKGHRTSFRADVSTTRWFDGATNDWYTPQPVIATLLDALGRTRFDLDPASPSRSGPVPARIRYTREDDGLAQPWRGLTFLNPPFRPTLLPWIRKAAGESAAGNADVVALLPVRTSTRWWHDFVGQTDHLILRDRISYDTPDGPGGPAPFGAAVVAWTADSAAFIGRLAERMPGIVVPRRAPPSPGAHRLAPAASA